MSIFFMLGGETLCGGMAWLSGLEIRSSATKLCILIDNLILDVRAVSFSDNIFLASFGWNTNPRNACNLTSDQKRCLPSWVKHFVTQRLGETVKVYEQNNVKQQNWNYFDCYYFSFRSNIRQVLKPIDWRVARSLGQAPAQWASLPFQVYIALPFAVGGCSAKGRDSCDSDHCIWVFPKIGVPPNHPF